MRHAKSDEHSEHKTRERLRKILRGAFAGPPTQLKDIPKRHGESRVERKNGAAKSRSNASRPRPAGP